MTGEFAIAYLVAPLSLHQEQWSDSVAKYGSHQLEEAGLDLDVAVHRTETPQKVDMRRNVRKRSDDVVYHLFYGERSFKTLKKEIV